MTGNVGYEFYPVEIQEALRVPYSTIQEGGPSQEIVYDMTGGWAFTINFLAVEETPRWQDQMKGTYKYDEADVPFIGAQWDAHKATHQPPDAFDDHAQYRSVIVRKFQ